MTEYRRSPRLRLAGLAILAVAAAPMPASPAAVARPLRLGELVTICGSGNDGCRAYVVGVADGFRIRSGAAKDQPVVCMPDQITEAQIVATVVRLAREDVKTYPADDNLLAASYIGAVLVSSYPCS